MRFECWNKKQKFLFCHTAGLFWGIVLLVHCSFARQLNNISDGAASIFLNGKLIQDWEIMLAGLTNFLSSSSSSFAADGGVSSRHYQALNTHSSEMWEDEIIHLNHTSLYPWHLTLHPWTDLLLPSSPTTTHTHKHRSQSGDETSSRFRINLNMVSYSSRFCHGSICSTCAHLNCFFLTKVHGQMLKKDTHTHTQQPHNPQSKCEGVNVQVSEWANVADKF